MRLSFVLIAWVGWVGGKIHCHLYSFAGMADGTEEEEATKTFVA